MGFLFSKIVSSLFPLKDTKILLVGLDGAGKTTLLYKLKLNELISTVPTIGFNVEAVEYGNLKMTIWDIGGQTSIRKLWAHYFRGNDAVIFIVDSADEERMKLAKEELHRVMSDDELSQTVLLVFANKQDIATKKPYDIVEELDLKSLRCPWYIQGCSATLGDGVYEGLDWLSKALKSSKRIKA